MSDLSPELHEHQGGMLRTLAFRYDRTDPPEWKTLNKLLVEFYAWRSDDPLGIDAADEIEAAVTVLEDASRKGLIEKYEFASVRDTPMRITVAGEKALPEWNVAYTPVGDVNPPDEHDALPAEGIAVDSATWTGLTERIIDARNAKILSKMIDNALGALSESNASNFKIMQAASYLKAAKELVDAPEPPSQLIWQLIGKAADLAGLIALFYAIFSQVAS